MDYDTADADDVMTNLKVDKNFFSSYSIDANGVITAVIKTLSYTDAGGTAHEPACDIGPWASEVEVGRVTLATFVNAVGLEREGDSLYSSSTQLR